jgi:hypothetical protein
MRAVKLGDSSRPCRGVELVKKKDDGPDDGVTDERLSSETPRRQRSAGQRLVDDPHLIATLDEVDLALDAATPAPYLAPPPLTARLVLPLSNGRWSPILDAESDSFTAEPLSDAHFRALDGGLTDEHDEPEPIAAPPPLKAWLPGPIGAPRRKKVPQAPVRKSSPPLGEWMVSATLILLVFAGAAASAVVFRERLSAIVVHWDLGFK